MLAENVLFRAVSKKGCFANSQRLSANRIPLKFAFPGGFEPPTFRLGGGRTILLCNGNVFNFWLIYWVFRPSGATR